VSDLDADDHLTVGHGLALHKSTYGARNGPILQAAYYDRRGLDKRLI
jgi:hypothetical protein